MLLKALLTDHTAHLTSRYVSGMICQAEDGGTFEAAVRSKLQATTMGFLGRHTRFISQLKLFSLETH